jgi:hydrogenase nickel incorporation protein HypB
MCAVCGCGNHDSKIEGVEQHPHFHVHADGTAHSHVHADGTSHSHPGEQHHGHQLLFGPGQDRAHAPGVSRARMVQVERDILSKNDAYAAENRRAFRDHGIFALNLVSSPGSGKTTLLVRTVKALHGRHRICVIEGDQQTARDADLIRATGIPAIQINTGRGCHLDAHMVGRALKQCELPDGGLLFIENVGNLVCPAAFDLGEAHKVAILSVTEGEDKPLKYPDMFAAADLMLLNKVDLLPYLDFDVPLAIEYARRINPDIRVIVTSARSGEGMEEWVGWLDEQVALTAATRNQAVEHLAQPIVAPEAEVAGLQR